MSFVIDNTNVTKEVRKKYIDIAKDMNIPIIGYYFKSDIKQSIERNNNRTGRDKIPQTGIFSTYKKLEIPSLDEGFTKLFYVDNTDIRFVIKEWQNEI